MAAKKFLTAIFYYPFLVYLTESNKIGAKHPP